MKTLSSPRECETFFWFLLPCLDQYFPIWKSLRLFFLLLCLLLCGSWQFSEMPSSCGYEHQERSHFPPCQLFTERKSSCVPSVALGPSPLNTSEKLFPPHSLRMLRRVLKQGGKSHSSMHQKFKGIIYALNFSYTCLYHHLKFMTIWIYCILSLPLRAAWMSCWCITPGCGHTVYWGLCSHQSHLSSHFMCNRRSFCEVIAFPSRQGKHFTFTQDFCRVLSGLCPISPCHLHQPVFSSPLFSSLTHTSTLALHLLPSAISMWPELLQNLSPV